MATSAELQAHEGSGWSAFLFFVLSAGFPRRSFLTDLVTFFNSPPTWAFPGLANSRHIAIKKNIDFFIHLTISFIKDRNYFVTKGGGLN
jgi:hypothetical protein